MKSFYPNLKERQQWPRPAWTRGPGFRNQLEAADADRLREMLSTFTSTLMNAEVEALCGAEYGERTPERTNSRNGYRERSWDTRAGRIELAIPKLRTGSYFPDWLLARRRRSEQALVQVIAECYVRSVSTRRVGVDPVSWTPEHLAPDGAARRSTAENPPPVSS